MEAHADCGLESRVTLTRKASRGLCACSLAPRPAPGIATPAPCPPWARCLQWAGQGKSTSEAAFASLDGLSFKVLRQARKKQNLTTGSVEINIINLTSYQLSAMNGIVVTSGLFTESKLKDRKINGDLHCILPPDQLSRLKITLLT